MLLAKTLKRISRKIELLNVAQKIKFKEDVYFGLDESYSDSQYYFYTYQPDLIWQKDKWNYLDKTVSKVDRNSTLQILQQDISFYLAAKNNNFYIVPSALVTPYSFKDSLIDYLQKEKEIQIFLVIGLVLSGLTLLLLSSQLPLLLCGGLWIALVITWIYGLIDGYYY